MTLHNRTATLGLALVLVCSGVVAGTGPAVGLTGTGTQAPSLAGDATLTDGSVYWQGQQLDRSDGVGAGTVLEVRSATDAETLQVQVVDDDGDGRVTVDTAPLAPGTYFLEDAANARVATFEIVAQSFAVSRGQGALTVTADRGSYTVEVTAPGVNGATLAGAIGPATPADDDGDGVDEVARFQAGSSTTVSFDPGALPDDATLSFAVTDTTASDTLALGDGGSGDDGTDESESDEDEAEDDRVLQWSTDVSPGEILEVRENATGTLVRQVVAESNGTAILEVGSMSAGTYVVEDETNTRLGTFTVVGEDGDDDESDADEDDGSDADGEDGRVLRWSDGVSSGEILEIRENATGTLVRQVVAEANGTAVVDVGSMPAGTYVVEDAVGARLGTFTVADDAGGSDGSEADGSDEEADENEDAASGPTLRWSDGVAAGDVVEVRDGQTDALYVQVVAAANGTAVVDLGQFPAGIYVVEGPDDRTLGSFQYADRTVRVLSSVDASSSDGAEDDPAHHGWRIEDRDGDGRATLWDVLALLWPL